MAGTLGKAGTQHHSLYSCLEESRLLGGRRGRSCSDGLTGACINDNQGNAKFVCVMHLPMVPRVH